MNHGFSTLNGISNGGVVGFPLAYVDFDAVARLVVTKLLAVADGWRVSKHAKTAFVLDALEQVLNERRPTTDGGLIHRRSWPSIEAVELATLHWVDWFNHRRILDANRQHTTR